MSDKDDGAPPRRPWQSYHTVFTNAKAGMDGVDKEKVQKIVYEMSKGSKYFENEEKKEAFIKQKIENMRSQCAKLTPADISHYQTVADKKIAELEVTRDLSKIWLHVDMDAFYAAVETLHNPSLKGKPMAVGGMSMISTANYEARKFGVRAAMPGFIARKLCPELIFVPPDFKKYTHCSDLTRKVFYRYDPNFIASSLDEAYLDITEICKARGISSEEIASELRTGVYEETGLTCSAGVAPNRMIAKVCSDINKPNGHFVLPNDQMAVMTFISSLPIRKIGGIGKVTEHVLRDVFGISTCEEILQKSAYLCALFSQSSIDFFLSVGLGLGKTETPQIGSRKSISCERTFSATEDEASLYSKIEEIAVSLSRDMEKEGLSGRTLTLKLKTASFEVRTRAISLQKCIFSSEDILLHACKLLKPELPLSLRLIGLRMSHFNDDKFVPDPTQKTLSSYIISGNKSAKDKSDISSLCSDTSNTSTISGKVTGLPIDANGISLSDADLEYGYGEPSNSKQFPYFEINSSVLSNATGEMEDTYMNLPEEYQAKVASPQSTGYATPTKEAVGLKMVDGEKNQSLWVDDYKCSLCGVELPPSFLEERQEHSDYHYAELLQRKESQHNTSNFMQRVGEKIQVTGKSGRKKQKTSPKDCKHIPIDLFFVKSNQNF